jgi:heptosyltransferase-3
MQPVKLTSAPRRILVVCLRRLGDVLLSTALIRSLRTAWPGATIHVLVNAASAPALAGNPDVDELLVQPRSLTSMAGLCFIARIFRRYDLAVCTLYNDRPHLYTLLASGTRATVVPPQTSPGSAWKRRLSTGWCELKLGQVHAVQAYLALADCLGIQRVPLLVPPRPDTQAALDAILPAGWQAGAYAVVHPSPMYVYKAWVPEGWVLVVRDLVQRGLRVYLTGGPAAQEATAIERVLEGLLPGERDQVQRLDGKLAFADLTPLVAGACVFVGPDTSVTHLAAAAGTPTVALLGPSHPVAWGPWPRGWEEDASPWQLRGRLQHQGNVWLVQGDLDCVPCLKEGCDRHVNSRAECLQQLPAARVVDVMDRVPGVPPLQRPITIIAAPWRTGT